MQRIPIGDIDAAAERLVERFGDGASDTLKALPVRALKPATRRLFKRLERALRDRRSPPAP